MKQSIDKRLDNVEKRLAADLKNAAYRTDAQAILKWFDEAMRWCAIDPLPHESKMDAFARYLGISAFQLKGQLGLCVGEFRSRFDKAMRWCGIDPLLGISTFELNGQPGPRLLEFRLRISTSIGSPGRVDAPVGTLPEFTAEGR